MQGKTMATSTSGMQARLRHWAGDDTPSQSAKEPRPHVELRGLTGRDQPQHVEHLLRLTAEDRRARFHSATKDETIRAYSEGLEWHKVLIFGLFVDGTLRAAGELLQADGSTSAEISLSVEKEFQHGGFGKTLVLALVLAARRVGVTHLTMSFLGSNHSMRAIARDLGAVTDGFAPVIESVKVIPPAARLKPAADKTA